MPLSAPIEKIVWSRPPDMPGIELLTVENNQRSWCLYHNTYTVCAIVEFAEPLHGEAEWVYRRKIHLSHVRTLMLMEPGEIHRNTMTPPLCHFRVALFDPGLVAAIAAESGLKPNPHLQRAVTADCELYGIFLRLFLALTGESSSLCRQSLLVGCIGALLARHGEKPVPVERLPARQPLKVARDYLHAYYASEIALGDLARIAGLSRYHFLRSFAAQFGLPPHAYQIKLRIERARALLKAGLSPGEIDVGFSDQPHLTRHFKKFTGVTPGQYREMAGACRRRSKQQ